MNHKFLNIIVKFIGTKITPRSYLLLVMIAPILCIGTFSFVNWVSNDFGLWRHKHEARIWGLEKTSKYLMAQKYVPENFDSILLGPSLSANMDTRNLKRYNVYNLSMAGGNITELSAAAEKFISASSRPKAIFICLAPYITMNSGMKSFQIDERERIGSLFSIVPIVVWKEKILFLVFGRKNVFHDSVAGMNDMNIAPPSNALSKWIAKDKDTLLSLKKGEKIENHYSGDTFVDPIALAQLKGLLEKARDKNVKIIGYYYPVMGSILDIMMHTGDWKKYQDAINPVFESGEIVLDMTSDKYKNFRSDVENYRDPTHLSYKGSHTLIKILNESF